MGSTANSSDILKQILTEISEIKRDAKKIDSCHNQIVDLKSSVDSAVQNTEKIVSELRKEISNLRSKLSFLETENELLHRQANFQNLIISGVSDSENETNSELCEKIKTELFAISPSLSGIDTAYRIGVFKNGKIRPVRVRFYNHSERNKVYEERSKIKKPIYINEDLPKSIRRDYYVIRQKRRDLINDKIDFKIDWRNKTITTSASTFTVRDGKLFEDECVSDSEMETSPMKKTERRGKRSINGGNQLNTSESQEPPSKRGKTTKNSGVQLRNKVK